MVVGAVVGIKGLVGLFGLLGFQLRRDSGLAGPVFLDGLLGRWTNGVAVCMTGLVLVLVCNRLKNLTCT